VIPWGSDLSFGSCSDGYCFCSTAAEVVTVESKGLQGEVRGAGLS